MTARILDGNATAAAIKGDLKARVASSGSRAWSPASAPSWSATTPASRWYVTGKHKDCAEVGIDLDPRRPAGDRDPERGRGAVAELNADPACTGYIVQLPLPGT